jgi:hypothetical protein
VNGRWAYHSFATHACVYRKLHPSLLSDGSRQVGAMIVLICFVLAVPASPFKSKSRRGGADLLEQD